jgi:sorbitol-specific phosphotransferase system component IIC
MLIGFFDCGWQQFSEEQQHLLIFITLLTIIFVIFADTIFFIGRDRTEKLLRFVDGILIQRIIRPFAFCPRFDKTALTEEFHVMRQRGLGHLEFL